MADFSIEMAEERIVDTRTRRYFSEVSGAYSAGHYRSAVVMLWSVVVCDVLFKLDQLSKAYGDSIAEAILVEIGDTRKKNPKSPEWEADLMSKVASRTDMLDAAELSHLQSLQAHRHLSAHPVLTSGDALFSPNRETARAHIRNALEAVLTKPAFMSKKVFDRFVEDIEELSKLRPARDALQKFLESKYFPHLTLVTEKAVFRSLWRVVFKSSDVRAESNRQINAVALSIVFQRRKSELTQMIEDERPWFSDVSFGATHLASLAAFFRENPGVFDRLSEAAKAPLREYSNLSLDNYALCWFLSPTPEAHLAEVLRRVKEESQSLSGEGHQALCQSLRHTASYSTALSVGIALYARSPNFDTADTRFAGMVRPYVADFDRNQIVEFLNDCERNGQTWARGRAHSDHLQISTMIAERFSDVSLIPFPNFQRTTEG